MAKPYLFETLGRTVATNRLQIATLIGDLSRKADILTADIENEETRSGVGDWADPTYSVLARSLRTRRDNIMVTIASLETLVRGTPKAA